jgi:hypothetical protein
MADALGMVSGSDDDDDPVESGDDGEVPAPLPLSLLEGSAAMSTKPARPSKSPSTTEDNNDATPKNAMSAKATMSDPEEGGQAERTGEDSDESDDESKLTTPNQLPPHKPLAEPSAAPDIAEPFDAARAAELARKGAPTDGGPPVPPLVGGGRGASLSNAASEKTPGVVDDALRDLVFMLKGEKNDSLCQVPMCQCVHGLVKDEEGNTWPPYEITLLESRQSQFNRQQWLTEHMQTDPNRLLNTILFFNVDPEASLDLNDLPNAASHKLQAMLPGVLVNPDDNADAAKRIDEYNAAIGSADWTFAIPVPAQFVKTLYRQQRNGLPSLYNPVAHDNVKFQLFDKVENQATRDSRWKLVVDKSREGQANAAAANGSSRARVSRTAADENGVPRKRPTKPAGLPVVPALAAGAAISETEPAPLASTAANIQTTLRFAPRTTPVATPAQVGVNNVSHDSATSATSATSTASTASDAQALVVHQQLDNATQPMFAQIPLPWTAISPEWYSVVVPKLPKGFAVEISAPTQHCSGMVSFKRSSAPDEHDI